MENFMEKMARGMTSGINQCLEIPEFKSIVVNIRKGYIEEYMKNHPEILTMNDNERKALIQSLIDDIDGKTIQFLFAAVLKENTGIRKEFAENLYKEFNR